MIAVNGRYGAQQDIERLPWRRGEQFARLRLRVRLQRQIVVNGVQGIGVQ